MVIKFLMLGGFLCFGNIILFIGIDDDRVFEVIDIIF